MDRRKFIGILGGLPFVFNTLIEEPLMPGVGGTSFKMVFDAPFGAIDTKALSPMLEHLMGKSGEHFPLSYLIQNTESKVDEEFTWPIMQSQTQNFNT